MNNTKIKNKIALKYGSYAAAITAIIIVVAVLVNLLVGFLANRFHLEVDLTTDKLNTIDATNQEYIKNVERPVEIIVCASEEGYVGDVMAYYAYNYYSAEDTNGHYAQTVKLLKEYPNYNTNIDLKFIDPQQPDFSVIASKYPTEQFVYGDIIVRSEFELNGEQISRYKIIGYTDVYDLTDPSGMAEYGYGTYEVGGTNVETRVTSAIYYATSDKIINAATLSGHSNKEAAATLIDTLEINSYNVTDIPDAIISSKSFEKDVDILILAGVTSDFTLDELSAINTFLENGDDRGKGLLFFASPSSPALPNLYGFLEEWGITVGDGLLFETNENYVVQNYSNMLMIPTDDEHLAEFNISNGIFISGNNIPLSTAYESNNKRYTHTLIQTSDSVVLAPFGTSTEWEPDKTMPKSQYSTAILTRDTSYENNSEGDSSYVIAFSSTDFISSLWAQYPTVYNKNLTLHLANLIGKIDNDIEFVIKTISTQDFAQTVTHSAKLVVLIIFVIMVPVTCLAVCIAVYVRRRRR
ncbi:MAG: GldG family protein [Clostridia bacterium]|nr:GldG family protein [Clostridia bacterium]